MGTHVYDQRTMLCRCGRTYENHMNITLTNEKVRARWVSGDVDLERDFAELNKVIDLTTPSI